MNDDFMNWLNGRGQAVADMEARAKELIISGDMDSYRALMHAKAELLANLSDDSCAFLHTLPLELRSQVGAALRRFSSSAEMALKLGSVFFMSALLYPDEHQEGQPNDLDKLIAHLKCDNEGS